MQRKDEYHRAPRWMANSICRHYLFHIIEHKSVIHFRFRRKMGEIENFQHLLLSLLGLVRCLLGWEWRLGVSIRTGQAHRMRLQFREEKRMRPIAGFTSTSSSTQTNFHLETFECPQSFYLFMTDILLFSLYFWFLNKGIFHLLEYYALLTYALNAISCKSKPYFPILSDAIDVVALIVWQVDSFMKHFNFNKKKLNIERICIHFFHTFSLKHTNWWEFQDNFG